MHPRFRFAYVLAAAALTYGALYAFNTPRPFGHRGWGHGPGWHNHGGCGQSNDCRAADSRVPTPAPAAAMPPGAGKKTE